VNCFRTFLCWFRIQRSFWSFITILFTFPLLKQIRSDMSIYSLKVMYL